MRSLLAVSLLLAGCVDPPSATVTAVRTATARPEAPPPAVSASASPAPRVEKRAWPRAVLTWRYDTSAIGPTSVVVFSPATTERLPVLIALHGLGEAQKGPERGARGWIDDYGLLTAVERLHAPPLTEADMQKLGTTAHLARVNEELAAEPYRGLVVVCPYTPDIIGTERRLDAADALGKWLVEELIPRVYRETPAIGTPKTTGIDGVSLGGRAALLVGTAHADRFGVLGSLQAAVYPHELGALAERIEGARRANGDLGVRLLTSDNDFYRPALTQLSNKLGGIDHRFVVLARGPHSYAFNRGLGVYAMLMFHDRALRRE